MAISLLEKKINRMGSLRNQKEGRGIINSLIWLVYLPGLTSQKDNVSHRYISLSTTSTIDYATKQDENFNEPFLDWKREK